MTGFKAVFLKVSVLFFVVILLVPSIAGAFNYTQPAYISTFYLCNKLVKQGNSIQPEIVLNALRADNPQEAAHIVVDFIGRKGIHNPEVEILDANGRLYAESIKVNPITVQNDGGFFRVAPRISGVFPKGGVFFKVSDTLDSGSRTTLGMFGVTTVN